MGCEQCEHLPLPLAGVSIYSHFMTLLDAHTDHTDVHIKKAIKGIEALLQFGYTVLSSMVESVFVNERQGVNQNTKLERD